MRMLLENNFCCIVLLFLANGKQVPLNSLSASNYLKETELNFQKWVENNIFHGNTWKQNRTRMIDVAALIGKSQIFTDSWDLTSLCIQIPPPPPPLYFFLFAKTMHVKHKKMNTNFWFYLTQRKFLAIQ